MGNWFRPPREFTPPSVVMWLLAYSVYGLVIGFTGGFAVAQRFGWSPFANAGLGLIYLLSAVALGAVFLWRAWQVNQNHTPLKVLRLYKYSLVYLALLFVAMVVDRMVMQFII